MTSISGEAGNFEVEVFKKPRYVDMDKCIACGACTEKCPKKIDDFYNASLKKRKAIYVEYDQAVPLKYVIDPANCIKLTKGKCGNCEKVCPAGAINYDDKPETLKLKVGSIVLAPGFKPFNPSIFDTYQYAKFPNVVTSMEFERILSASGPTMGHLTRMSKDHEEPKKIAWFQCIGSRDMNRCDNAYCSSVCCMYAIKEAAIAKEHNGDDLDCAIFFMDMRTHGKDFERYYENAKKKGVRFVRSRVHTINPIPENDSLEVRYVTEDGRLETEIFDMIVLSIGLETDPSTVKLANQLGIKLTKGNFCEYETFKPVATSREGIFVAGAFAGPKDIPQAMIDASAAASAAGELLSSARNTLTKTAEAVKELNVAGDRPRVGVFVCSCGSNIAGTVDVKALAEYSSSLPYVEYVTNNLFACSQDTQDKMAEIIKEKNLNRVVVAACTPKTHEPLFQETLINAGLNKYLFEMVNIRNHGSWVHKDQPAEATLKAKEQVRMAVAKVALFEPLSEATLEIDQNVLVIGGGISGMAAAKALSTQGYHVTLVERDKALGGQARNLYVTAKGESIEEGLADMVNSVAVDEKIDVLLESSLKNVEGFVGNFVSTIETKGSEREIRHGVAIIATGAEEYKPTEYLYGSSDKVVTGQELDILMKAHDARVDKAESAVFIQCVGSREPGRTYCSRICCTHTMVSALHLKEKKPDMDVFVLYRDIRTYGEKEALYKKAREKGVIFVRYSLDAKPLVKEAEGKLLIRVNDPIIQRPLEIAADLLVLASAVKPFKDERLAQFFKVPLNDDGFFVEAHVKLAPSDFATDGVFLAGLAHYPKPIDESIAQAQAAAARATGLLARKTINTSGQVAYVNSELCSGCSVCVAVCPYNSPGMILEGPRAGKAEINPVLCKGCGACVASCRSGALNLKGFEEGQILAMINAA